MTPVNHLFSAIYIGPITPFKQLVFGPSLQFGVFCWLRGEDEEIEAPVLLKTWDFGGQREYYDTRIRHDFGRRWMAVMTFQFPIFPGKLQRPLPAGWSPFYGGFSKGTSPKNPLIIQVEEDNLYLEPTFQGKPKYIS